MVLLSFLKEESFLCFLWLIPSYGDEGDDQHGVSGVVPFNSVHSTNLKKQPSEFSAANSRNPLNSRLICRHFAGLI
jgi:hypothetical protein